MRAFLPKKTSKKREIITFSLTRRFEIFVIFSLESGRNVGAEEIE
jgi:hypothetical protein